jgi:hypothetical protein
VGKPNSAPYELRVWLFTTANGAHGANADRASDAIAHQRGSVVKGTRYADHAEGISSKVAQRPDDNQCHHRQAANYALGRRAQDNAN